MKSYLNYKNQLLGLESVLETTRTIEKVAASSIHFLKEKIVRLNIYTNRIDRLLARLYLFYPQIKHPLLIERDNKKKGLIIISGDKGLVGKLWHQLIGLFVKSSEDYHSFIVIGTKGRDYLKEEKLQPFKWFTFSAIVQLGEFQHIIPYVFEYFKENNFSRLDILYPHFISLVEQRPVLIPFLPFRFSLFYDTSTGDEERDESLGLPIFEPSKKRIFSQLLEKKIKAFFYKIILETKLSELSARTATMENATVKTQKLIHRLKLTYLKERRRVVTQKQLESFIAHQYSTKGEVL